MILYNTLYRYLVLFGLPDSSAVIYYGDRSPVLSEILKLCKQDEFQHTFEADQKQFSLESGKHSSLQRARERLQKEKGAMDFLLGCANFNPSKRIKMSSALKESIFSEYRNQMREDLPEQDLLVYHISLKGVGC